MPVYVRNNVPAICFKTSRGVICKPSVCLAVDRYSVVIIDTDELGEPKRTRKRGCFMRNTFHQATITDEDVSKVINNIEIVAVKTSGQYLFRNSHSHRIGKALTQRAGRRLNTRGLTIFRMTGGYRTQLPEIPKIIHRQVITCQVKQGIKQHGTMAIGQHEAVSIQPTWICGVVAQNIGPQDFGNIGHTHGGAGMPTPCFLDSIHRQGTHCIGNLGSVHRKTGDKNSRVFSLTLT